MISKLGKVSNPICLINVGLTCSAIEAPLIAISRIP